ncbi:MAG: class I SAM-dependent methyltransferase [Acidobacteria bacterium]|nr:class I SAM-dependent methyltransferase [Acidobacteriota bacterium]
MDNYYDKKLSSLKLKKVYDIATPRIRQYMQAEIDHLLDYIQPGSVILELGCGYGRVMKPLAKYAGFVWGIDSASMSLQYGLEYLDGINNFGFACMNAVSLGFKEDSFDLVFAVQNGISAFHEDKRILIEEALRVTKPGGFCLFSSYSEKIWEERLRWFELQSEAGLLGEIDYEKTGNGEIVCKDGFTATTVSEEDFFDLTEGISGFITIRDVDDSSTFCEIRKW